MSFVIIFYLSMLSLLLLAYISRGINLLRKEIDEPRMKRIRTAFNTGEEDKIEFEKFNKYDAGLSFFTGLLYLFILFITFRLVPELTGKLSDKDIHLIRTCVIAMLVIYLLRVLWLEKAGEKFISRTSNSAKPGFNFKTAVIFIILLVSLIYSIFIQITYAW